MPCTLLFIIMSYVVGLYMYIPGIAAFGSTEDEGSEGKEDVIMMIISRRQRERERWILPSL